MNDPPKKTWGKIGDRKIGIHGIRSLYLLTASSNSGNSVAFKPQGSGGDPPCFWMRLPKKTLGFLSSRE